MSDRDPRVDPRPGDIVGHIDGGRVIIFGRTQKMVCYQRHRSLPGHWARLSTFQAMCKDREVIHVAD